MKEYKTTLIAERDRERKMCGILKILGPSRKKSETNTSQRKKHINRESKGLRKMQNKKQKLQTPK